MKGARIVDRGFARLSGLLFLAAALVGLASPAKASEAIWLANCDGCHGATPSGARVNAAGGNSTLFDKIFDYTQSTNPTYKPMSGFIGGLTATQKNSLGTYLETIFNVTPVAAGSTAYNVTKVISISGDVIMGTGPTNYSVLESVSPPGKGTVTYSTANREITYNPGTCETGSDSFSYRARNSGSTAVSSTRTVNISITTPIATIASSSVASGTFGTAISPYTIFSTVFPCSSQITFGASNLPPGLSRSGAVISGTPTAAGTYNVTLSAQTSAGTDTQTLTFTINKANQSLTFPIQSPNPRSFSTSAQAIVQVTASGGSGNAIVYSSGSPSVCSVNNAARTWTMLTAGTCTIDADQAGNANYNAGAASRTVIITATAPGVPTGIGGAPAPAGATISFTAPTNNGGQTPLTYTATCSAAGQTTRTNTGSASPITVGSMTPSVVYACSVTAGNTTGTSAASASVNVTPSAGLAPPAFTSANNATFTVLQNNTFTVTATGNPAPTLSLFSGTPPSGVNFTAATGVLTGTPAAGTVGSYTLTFRATNNTGTPNIVSQTFTLTVAKRAQAITFTQPANPTSFSLSTIPMSASSTSGLTVVFTSATPSVCSVSGANVTMITIGTCTINANHPGNADYSAATQVQRSFDINPGTQTITFPAQNVVFRNYVQGGTFAILPLATVNSNLAITYSSTTPGICTVSGTTVTMVSAGTCFMQAAQTGNANWNAATPVVSEVAIQAVVPAAPVIGVVTGGNASAIVTFTPPTNTGGTPLTGFKATCGAVTTAGASSPITVSGLANGATVACSVVASNSAGDSPPSASVNVTPAISGASLWQTVCSNCHGVDPPSGPRFNAAGTTATVLQYVRANQPLMQASAEVQALSASELAALAVYIAEQVPQINTYAKVETPKPIDVSSHLTLNTVAFTQVEVLTPPSVGTLSAFTGTRATYTPPAGFTGQVFFTYRGRRNSPTQVLGDERSVLINVDANARQLVVTKSGIGTGVVSSSPVGLSCGAVCTDYFEDSGKNGVTLMATADFGSTFTGWSGVTCQGGSNTDTVCSFDMDGDKSVTATFTSDAPPEIVAQGALDFGDRGSGSGRVTLPLLVSNIGLGDTTPISVIITGTNASDFDVTYPCDTIPGNTQCTFTIGFTPTTLGTRSAFLTIISNDPVNPTVDVLLEANVVAADTTPNAFTFTDQSSVALGATATSNAVAIGGINAPAAISVTGGTYSVGCTASFTSGAGTISNGETVCVRHTAAATPATATNTVLTIGGVSDTFTSTTVAADTTPDAFAFTDVTNVIPGTLVTSNAITVAGINDAAAISVTGGSYSVGCNGTFTTNAGTVSNGNTVCVRHTASGAASTTVNTVLTIGGVSDTYSSTTMAALPPNGDFDNDGIPNAIETAESRNPFVKDNDIFTVSRLFAMQQYRDFLGREGDAGGLQFYTDLLNNGTVTRDQVIESFLASPEFTNGLPPIIRLYFATFLRIPDYDGLIFQVNAFRSGASLTGIATNFTLSPEFTALYGNKTDAEYVQLLYNNVLGRTASQPEIDFHVNRLQNQGATRGDVLVGFSESPEYQQSMDNECWAISVYVGLLRRTPEQAGLDFYVNLLDGGTPRANIIPGFSNSTEYRNRFLP